MQCCTCSKWAHLRCSPLSFSRFKTLGSSHSWSCPSCCMPVSSGGPTPTKTVSSSLDSSSWYTSTVQPDPSGSPLQMKHCRPPCLQTSYPPSVHFVSSPCAPSPPLMFLAVFLHFLLPLLTPSGFFNGMLEVSKPGALNYYTLSRLIL